MSQRQFLSSLWKRSEGSSNQGKAVVAGLSESGDSGCDKESTVVTEAEAEADKTDDSSDTVTVTSSLLPDVEPPAKRTCTQATPSHTLTPEVAGTCFDIHSLLGQRLSDKDRAEWIGKCLAQRLVMSFRQEMTVSARHLG